MKEKKAKQGKESPPGKSMPRRTMALILLPLGAIALVLVFLLLGLLPPSPPAAASTVPSYMVYVPGNDHGNVLLVGRSSCPHCQDTKRLLANLSVGYYWVDLDSLDQVNTMEIFSRLKFCGQLDFVPILVINNSPPCIIGFNETRIREALG